MADFTPQEIEQFLEEFFDTVGARQYVGARYVPIFGRAGEDTVEWDDLAPYEPLTVVMHEGVSYVSRRYVPSGIQLADTAYWVETYRFNAQVEQYRQQVLTFQGQIDQLREDMEADYVPFPDSATYPKYGTTGQVLTTLTNGATKWEDPVTVDAAIAEPLIDAWLADHPEATTTVQDGAITTAKIANGAVTEQKLAMVPVVQGNVSSNSDFNNFRNAGMYYAGKTACETSSNVPSDADVTRGGYLIVIPEQNNSLTAATIQVFTSVANGSSFTRRWVGGSSGSWSSWLIDKAESDLSDVQSRLQSIEQTAAISVINGMVESNSDLNDYRNAGMYYAGATACSTSANVPSDASISRGAYLTVIPAENNSLTAATIQVFTSVFDGVSFTRRWAGGSGGSWSEWTVDKAQTDIAQVETTLAEQRAEQRADIDKVSRNVIDNVTRITRKSGIATNDVLANTTFVVGNITSSGSETANQNYVRSDYVPTDEGDQFFVQYANPDNTSYRARFYFYDENRNYIGYSTAFTAFSNDVVGQVYLTVGKGFIRFVIFHYPPDTTPMLVSDVANVDFEVRKLPYKSSEIIRVATNNVRNWGTEHNYGYTGNYETNRAFYDDLYEKVAPTLLGLQEFSPYMDAAHQHQGSDVLRQFFAYFINSTSPRIPIASNIPMGPLTKGTTTTDRDYAYGTFTTESGKTITWLNFHAYPGTTAEAIANRGTEYQEILTLLGNDSFIITGDLNAIDTTEWNVFRNAGCNLANGGDFGTFITGTNDPLLYPFDNIITSGDIPITNVEVAPSSGTSDHKMLWCDIVV